ncbi:hypothetical protein PENSPDRAFT_684810 [Peniophora sp. CONT]|nr:hypothetical protein PENSPDRAFT_684810 [Peniophora sp. CONT]
MVGFWRRLVLPPVLENMRITYSGDVGWGPIVDTFAPYLAREPYNALAFRDGENDVFELCAFTFKDDGPAAFHPGAGRRGTWLGIAPSRYNGHGQEVEEGDDDEEENDEPLLQDILPAMLSHIRARADHITHLFFNTCNSYTLDDDNEDPPHPARIALRDELCAFTSVTVVCGAFWRFDFNVLSLSNKRRDSFDQDSDSEEEAEDNDLSPKLLPNLTTLVAYLNRDHSIRWRELHPLFKDRALARTPIQRLELIGPILPLDDDARGQSAASPEKGLVQAKSFGLREFVDRRVPLSEWQAHGPAFELFGIGQA